jgi:hypothetical protein
MYINIVWHRWWFNRQDISIPFNFNLLSLVSKELIFTLNYIIQRFSIYTIKEVVTLEFHDAGARAFYLFWKKG